MNDTYSDWDMPLSYDSNQISLHGGATNTQINPHISILLIIQYSD